MSATPRIARRSKAKRVYEKPRRGGIVELGAPAPSE
jgi:hypothetical protein